MLFRSATGEMTILVTERSIFTDRHVFLQMLLEQKNGIGKLERDIYDMMCKTIGTEHFTPDMIFALNTDPHLCYQRVLERSRETEEGLIEEKYLEDCHRAHQNMYTLFQQQHPHFSSFVNIESSMDKDDPQYNYFDTVHDMVVQHIQEHVNSVKKCVCG